MRIGRRRLMVTGFASSMAAWMTSACAKGGSARDVGEVRQAVMAVFRAAPGVSKVIADPVDRAKFTAVINGATITADVTELSGYLAAYPEDADEAIARFVRARLERQDVPVTDDMIVVVVRSRDYVDEVKRSGLAVLHEPIGADLFAVYMADRPDTVVLLTAEDLPGKSLGDTKKAALGNVRKWLPKVVADDSLGSGVLYYIEGNPTLSTGLLLVDEFWKSIQARFAGDVLVAVPRRDQLFIFDDSGPKTEAFARRLIKATYAEGFNLLSPRLYARRAGQIVAMPEA